MIQRCQNRVQQGWRAAAHPGFAEGAGDQVLTEPIGTQRIEQSGARDRLPPPVNQPLPGRLSALPAEGWKQSKDSVRLVLGVREGELLRSFAHASALRDYGKHDVRGTVRTMVNRILSDDRRASGRHDGASVPRVDIVGGEVAARDLDP